MNSHMPADGSIVHLAHVVTRVFRGSTGTLRAKATTKMPRRIGERRLVRAAIGSILLVFVFLAVLFLRASSAVICRLSLPDGGCGYVWSSDFEGRGTACAVAGRDLGLPATTAYDAGACVSFGVIGSL